MKRKITIIILLIAIAAACFFIGQANVQSSLFSLCDAFDSAKTEYDGKDALFLDASTVLDGTFHLGDSYVTLNFDYEVVLPDGQEMPADANIQIDIEDNTNPENVIHWAFEPGKMETTGSMSVDMNAFKGKDITMTFTGKGNFPEGGGVVLKNIYMSKLYAGK